MSDKQRARVSYPSHRPPESMSRTGKLRSKKLGNALLSLPFAAAEGALFCLFFVYVCWLASPPLRYSASAPPFLMDGGFLKRFAGYPGGLLQYGASFIAQLDCYAWLGALTSTGLAWGVAVLSRDLLRRTGSGVLQGVGWVPALLLLLLHNSYAFPVAPVAVGLLVALATAWCYAALLGRSGTVAKLFGFWGLAAGIFYLAGSWWLVLAVGICALIELSVPRRKALAAGCLVAVALIPAWQGGFPSLPIENGDLPGRGWPQLVFFGLLAALPLAMFVTVLFRSRASLPPARGMIADRGLRIAGRGDGGSLSQPPYPIPSRAVIAISGLGVVLSVWATTDLDERERLKVGYHTGRGEWAEAVSAARRVRSPDYVSAIQLVRALSHTGRLPEALFSFRLPEPFDLFPGLASRGFNSYAVQAHVLFELGQVNLAEHYAHEALELNGERPDVLLLLARINAAKDRPQAARIFLNALHEVPFHRAEAAEALRCLEGQGEFPPNWEIAAIRTMMPVADDPGGTIVSEDALRLLLRTNGRNRQALDYLMTHWLMTGQFDEIRRSIPKLAEAGYTALPAPCEQAALLGDSRRGAAGPDLQGLRVQEQTVEKYRRFILLRDGGESNRELLNREFAGSYWLFDLSRGNRRGRAKQ